MTILRLLPTFLATLLMAAHVMRFNGLIPAVLTLLLLLTLLVRKAWVLKLWQGLLAVAILIWLNTAYNLIQIRIAHDAAWLRLALILGLVTLVNVLAIFVLRTRKLQSRYQAD